MVRTIGTVGTWISQSPKSHYPLVSLAKALMMDSVDDLVSLCAHHGLTVQENSEMHLVLVVKGSSFIVPDETLKRSKSKARQPSPAPWCARISKCV